MSDRFDMDAGHSPALPLTPARPADVRVRFDEADAVERLKRAMIGALAQFPPQRRSRRIYLCIGTDRSTGDCLGPLVGSMLRDAGVPGDRVHGTLAEPVHAANLADWIRAGILEEQENGARPLVVAIDACLGQTRSIGSISLGIGALRPGAGVNKDLPAVGDVYVTGTVNVGGFMEYFVLQNTRLHLVMDMARVITAAIIRVEQNPSPGAPRPRPLRRFFPLR